MHDGLGNEFFEAVLGDPKIDSCACGVQTLLARATTPGLWAGRPWVRMPLILPGLAAIGTAIIETWVGIRPSIAAVGQSLPGIFATGGLCLIPTREFGTFDEPRVPSTRP